MTANVDFPRPPLRDCAEGAVNPFRLGEARRVQ
jgi:hypothetical protein